jgi:catechol 2,3-dioxygenase-like lactoylglutathione lyase family enzyme
VEAELRKRGLTPVADNQGKDFQSFHVKDPDGFDLQISNGNRKNRRQGPANGKTSAPAPFASTAWKTVWLDHISFEVSNYKETAAFYHALLGWKLGKDEGSQNQCEIGDVGDIIIRRGGGGNRGAAPPTAPPATGHLTACADPIVMAEPARTDWRKDIAAGATFTRPPTRATTRRAERFDLQIARAEVVERFGHRLDRSSFVNLLCDGIRADRQTPFTPAITDRVQKSFARLGTGETLVVDVVGAPGWPNPARHEIQVQRVPSTPGDVVIGARRVAAHANSPDEHVRRVVQRQAAAEDVDAADLLADERIVGRPELARRTLIRRARIDRIAFLQPEQGSAGLHRGPEIGAREGETRQAERVCGVRLLRRDHAAARPLRPAVGARERHRADDAVAVDDAAPHVEIESTIGGAARSGERCFEIRLSR